METPGKYNLLIFEDMNMKVEFNVVNDILIMDHGKGLVIDKDGMIYGIENPAPYRPDLSFSQPENKNNLSLKATLFENFKTTVFDFFIYEESEVNNLSEK